MQNDRLPKRAFKYHSRWKLVLEDVKADGKEVLEQDL
jgi:hypothetical protein